MVNSFRCLKKRPAEKSGKTVLLLFSDLTDLIAADRTYPWNYSTDVKMCQ